MIGLDGGGTSTRVAFADRDGVERIRGHGPAGLVDPRRPEESAAAMVRLIRETASEADIRLPAATLCAGLAGARSGGQRARIVETLTAAAVAERVTVVTDAEIALEGALTGEPGIILIAGTGSVAWGRAEDGRVSRCGGWGMWVGDEGSGYAVGLAGVRAALRGGDGRGPETRLLPAILDDLQLSEAVDVPGWVAHAEKAEIGRLAPLVIEQARDGDVVAGRILDTAAADLVEHVRALVTRLGPWEGPVAVVLHGGLFREGVIADRVEAGLHRLDSRVDVRPAAADAVTGALRMARASLEPAG